MLKNKKLTAILLALGFSMAGKSAYAVDNKANDEVKNSNVSIEEKSTEELNLGDSKKSESTENTDLSAKNNETSNVTNDSRVDDTTEKESTNDSEKDSNSNKVSEEDQILNLKSDKKEWVNVKGKLYYVTEDGLITETGWFKEKEINEDCENDNEYYINKDHSAATGWNKIDGNWYFFDEKGVMTTGWQVLDGAYYYLAKDGIMQTGWLDAEHNKYYLDEHGAMVHGKQIIDDAWHVFGDDGTLQTGFFDYKGKTYYADDKGVLGQNQYITYSNDDYYVKCDGTIAKGDVIIDGKTEEFDKDGKHIGTKELGEYLFVKYLSVGDADCAFIKLPNGETALIDTGDRKTADTVVDFLKNQNLKDNTIDYILISHAHSDHIGGLASILKTFNVKRVYLPEIAVMKPWHKDLQVAANVTQEDIDMVEFDYNVYKEAERAMQEKNLQFINTVSGEFIDSQKILKFVESDMDFSKVCENGLQEYWNLNQNSAIVYLNYDGFKGLFMGDTSNMAENQIYRNDIFKGAKVDALKAGHHGLDSASTEEFIEYVKPDICIMSRDEKSISKNIAYNNIVSNGAMTFETSAGENGGFSIYANKENWNGQE